MRFSGFSTGSVVAVILAAFIAPAALSASPEAGTQAGPWNDRWPVLRQYDRDHIEKISLPSAGSGPEPLGLAAAATSSTGRS